MSVDAGHWYLINWFKTPPDTPPPLDPPLKPAHEIITLYSLQAGIADAVG